MIYNKNKTYNIPVKKKKNIPVETVNTHVFEDQQENETYDIFESLSLAEKYKSLFDEPKPEPVIVVEEIKETESTVKVEEPIKEVEIKNTVVKEEVDKKNTISSLRDDFDKKLTQVRRLIYSYGGGGGSGTVATQYANGGIMNGNLEVVGEVTANTIQLADVEFTGETTTTVTSVTALGEFLKIKVNGTDRYIRLFSIE